MPSLSYCAFENTLREMQQVHGLLQDGEPLSKTEFNAAKKLLALAEEIAGFSADDLTQEDED